MARMILVGAGLATVLSVGAAAPAALADTTSPSPKPTANTALHKRGARMCKRIPKVEARVAKLTARFSADAGTRGSVLWLQARADKVRAKNPTLAAVIDDRAKIREARLGVLKLRADELTKVTAWCQAHGFTVGS